MDRREFLGGVALGLLAMPITAGARQAGKVYRIGLLGTFEIRVSGSRYSIYGDLVNGVRIADVY